jgi:hypothetical protein
MRFREQASAIGARLRDLFDDWRAEFDAAIPVSGAKSHAKRWRIVHLDEQDQTATPAGKGPLTVVRLPASAGIHLHLSLPAAARADLRSAIRLALLKASPLAPETVKIGWSTPTPESDGGRIRLDVALVPRERIERAQTALSGRFKRIDAIDLENTAAPDAPPRYDLHRERAIAAGGGSLSAWLVGACVAACAFGVAGHLAAAGAGLGDDPEKIAASSPLLRGVLALSRERLARPPSVEIFAQAAAALPDFAYLDSIELDGTRIRMRGRARGAANVVPAIDKSAFFSNARLVGATRDLPDSWQEFELTADFHTADAATGERGL